MRVRVVIEVVVNDEEVLRAYVEQRVEKVWGTPTEGEPEIWDGTIEYGVVEALVTSKEGATPGEMGFEVDFYTAEVLGA